MVQTKVSIHIAQKALEVSVFSLHAVVRENFLDGENLPS